jgi:hypothetical protein
MIAFLLFWIVVVIVIFPIGMAISKLILLFSKSTEEIPPFSIVIFLGLASVTMFSSVYSIFFPVNWLFKSLVILISILLAVRFKKIIFKQWEGYIFKLKNAKFITYIIFLLLFVLALLKSSGQTEIFDEGGYYLQFFKCVQEYGIIKGFGNLCVNFAINSHWHLLTASIGFSVANFGFFGLNGLFYILVSILALESINNLLSKNETNFSDIFLSFTPLLVYRSELTAASTDIIAAYLTWIIFFIFIKSFEKKLQNNPFSFIIINILIFWAFTIKPTSLSLLVIDIYYLIIFIRNKKWSNLIYIAIIAFVFILPWVIRNILLTGYLYIVFAKLDLFKFDWKVPAEMITIKSQYGIFGAFEPSVHWAQAFWKAVLPKDKILLLISIIALVYSTIKGLILLKSKKLAIDPVIIYSTIVIGFILWLVTAAEPRYCLSGMGFALIFLIVEAFIFIKRLYRNIAKLFIALILAGLVFNTAKSIQEASNIKNFLLMPAENPQVSFDNIVIKNMTFHKPTAYITSTENRKVFYKSFDANELNHQLLFAWNTPIPCFYSNNLIGKIEPRGSSIKNGFRIIK